MMDLRELLQMQNKLDATIFKNAGVKEYPLRKVKLALLTELGELANEVQSFKYWKQKKIINREAMLEEYADCLHFALSIENHLGQVSEQFKKDPYMILDLAYRKNVNKDKSFLLAYKSVVEEEIILPVVLKLGVNLGFAMGEIQQAYLKKYKKNIRRQQEGY